MIEKTPIQCQAVGGHKVNVMPETIVRVRRIDGGLLEVTLTGPSFAVLESPELLAYVKEGDGAATAVLPAPGAPGLPTDGNPPPGEPPPEAP